MTLFFVPKTVDMLVQHPQDQAINLFSLINNLKRIVGLQDGLDPKVMKDSFLAALGLLCKDSVPFVLHSMGFYLPTPYGRARPGSGACRLPPSCPSHSPSSVCV